ncbi:MAG TPA: rod shape-determining protein RodA [Acidimicrobiaceae bacterium]|nr:rod shape-determining protein RodA [Acidimicrobiaceae bacterium]HAX04667.1 rod shape-determining protein RodA [Acidimicrobiaceae bacterium]|tara:strand:- start:86 stop:1237 length:1152 start_codon:yes stop_codon:yes gene_type:complete
MNLPLRKELRSPLRYADYSLGLVAIVLSAIGVALNYSSTWRVLEFNGQDPATYAKRQILFVVLGVLVMVAATFLDYRLYRDFANQAYLLVMLALVGVLFFGVERNGARAWYELPGLTFQIQPAEFAKVAVVVALAAFVANQEGHLRLVTLSNAYLMLAVPLGLIYLQPDLGTMLVFVAIGMGVLLVSGAQIKHIAVTTVIGIIVIVGVFNSDNLGGPALLRQTQEQRLTAFLDPEFDLQGASYNINQSQIAIGAGGIRGQGWLQGTQTNLNLVPEQETDFIFTALGEEFGFIGVSALLLLYAYLLARIWFITRSSNDLFGTFVCVGALSMLTFQIFQNIGMTMGIMPITGIPLPFLSHGGSSTVVAFGLIGLVINISARRHIA